MYHLKPPFIIYINCKYLSIWTFSWRTREERPTVFVNAPLRKAGKVIGLLCNNLLLFDMQTIHGEYKKILSDSFHSS